MTYEELRNILTQRELLTAEHLPDLLQLSKRYPYSTSLHLLILRALYLSNDLRFASELHNRALYIPDLARLFLLLQEDASTQGSGHSAGVSEAEHAEDDPFDLIGNFLATHPEDGAGIPLIEPDTEVSGEDRLIAEDYLEWVDSREMLKSAPEAQEEETEDVIAEFLQKGVSAEVIPSEPTQERVLPTEETESVPYAEEELFTETLARIYIKQGKYDRALSIFNSLNLKYPQNNSYFAEQIKYLERLVLNSSEK